MRKKHVVIIPANITPKPTAIEISAAYILAEFFQKDVEFVLRTSQKTPDFKIGSLFWELKSPTGDGKRTLQHALQNAARQSDNIVIDARSSKLHATRIRQKLLYEARFIPRIKRLLLIEKDENVVEIISH